MKCLDAPCGQPSPACNLHSCTPAAASLQPVRANKLQPGLCQPKTIALCRIEFAFNGNGIMEKAQDPATLYDTDANNLCLGYACQYNTPPSQYNSLSEERSSRRRSAARGQQEAPPHIHTATISRAVVLCEPPVWTARAGHAGQDAATVHRWILPASHHMKASDQQVTMCMSVADAAGCNCWDIGFQACPASAPLFCLQW